MAGLEAKYRTATEDNDRELLEAWDDVTGKELKPEKVKAARQEEVQYIRNMKLYNKVPRAQARQLGAKVITVRWIDIKRKIQWWKTTDLG